MVGLIGILLSLGLLMFLAYRGINVLVLAPIMALLAALLGGAPLLATYTQVFMPALGQYAITYFPLFLLGAIFGKVMDDTGAAKAIADFIVEKVGGERAILAIVLACGILTYGGVSLFVVAFAVFPIAAALFREAGLAKRLIPAAIALGSFTFTMTALPGTPAIQNNIPNSYFGTNAFAAPGLGIIGGLIMFVGGIAWLTWRSRRLAAAGEGYDDGAIMLSRKERKALRKGDSSGDGGTVARDADSGSRDGGSGTGVTTGGGASGTATATLADETRTDEAADPVLDRPHMPAGLAFLPIVLVIGLNFALVEWIFPSMDFAYLEQDAYGNVGVDDVAGIWGIIVALVAAIALALVLGLRGLTDAKETVNKGTFGSLLPIFNTASEVGYGAVIASLAAFATIRDAVLGISGNPLITTAVSVNVLAGVTGSASGGMSIALETLGEDLRQLAVEQGISLEIMHRVTAMASGGFDALPHNGAVITLLGICGLTHRQSYKDIGMVAVLIPVIALGVVILLGTLFGSF